MGMTEKRGLNMRSRSSKVSAIPFKKDAVRGYLDRCMKAWRVQERRAQTLEDALVAHTYHEALQSVKEALFGNTKKS
jgi:hypothetical protein